MRRIKAFPFWKKQYLFHPKATLHLTLLNLYHPYNSIAKLNWWLWKKLYPYQNLFTYALEDESKLSQFIDRFMKKNPDYIWAINRGTKSIYQKTTGLFISKRPTPGHPDFFFKWGESKHGIETIKNEVAILNELKNYSFAPQLMQYQVDDKEAFYTTDIIHGTKYTSLEVNDEVLKLIDAIQGIRPHKAVDYCLSGQLQKSFHHGDFGPWNLIVENNTGIIKAIDWEFCGIYPKGFDLLYYIFAVEFLIKKNSVPETILAAQGELLNTYYSSQGISNWKPYLSEFADICSRRYANTKLGNDFLTLFNYCTRS